MVGCELADKKKVMVWVVGEEGWVVY